MGLPESVAESLSRSRAPRAALARDFALAFLRQEKELLLRSAQLDTISREIQCLTMRYLAARNQLSIRGIFGAPPMSLRQRAKATRHLNKAILYPAMSLEELAGISEASRSSGCCVCIPCIAGALSP